MCGDNHTQPEGYSMVQEMNKKQHINPVDVLEKRKTGWLHFSIAPTVAVGTPVIPNIWDPKPFTLVDWTGN